MRICTLRAAMFFPFRRELDDAFSHDSSIWLKMAGCALVGILIAVYSLAKMDHKDLTPAGAAIVIAVVACGGMFVGILLSLKDVVARRIENGEPVSLVLRIYFGWGGGSLLIWFLTIFIGTFVMIALT